MQQSLDHDIPASVPGLSDVPRGRRSTAWLPLVLVLVSAVAYGLFLVVPYYVNDLDRFTLDEVAGGSHDASGVWPYQGGGLLSVIWGYGAAFAILVGPFLTLGAPLWAAMIMWRDRRSLQTREWVALVTGVVFAVALIAELASPFHDAMIGWMLG